LSRVQLLRRDDAPPLARGWFRPDGSASPLTRSLANAPDVMETLMPFLGQIMAASSIGLPMKELVIVRVSQLNGCRYCLAAHRPIALEAGVPPEQLDAACDLVPVAGLAQPERAVVEFVDQVVRDASQVTDELVARTLHHVREDQLIELTLLAGAITLLNQYCTAFDIPPPS
jgi:AhpD family alkylhydroperoxidase